jgi:flagellar motor switch protein FliN/FliY
MVVDHDEIEALLAQADGLAEETRTDSPEPTQTAVRPPPASRRVAAVSPELARILKIQVPVIVQLASRRMSISAVRKLSLGMIIEFHKSVDEPLELLINNHPVGRGDAVKVGEHFGLRVTEIHDAQARIRSMGG